MEVCNLFVKKRHGQPMTAAASLHVLSGHIRGHVASAPLRRVLLVSEATLRDFTLRPGDLRENILVSGDALDTLPSGTVLAIGDVRIRLTIHCEPCKVIADRVDLRSIVGRRGYLGAFLSDGAITSGQEIHVLNEALEPIPSDLRERIVWFFKSRAEPITAADLVWQIGLAPSYCRAIPRLMSGLPIDARLVTYKRSAPALPFDVPAS